MEPFNDSTLDSGLALAISAASTGNSLESIALHMAKKSGMEPKEAAERVNFVYSMYEAQVAKYVGKQGIGAGELSEFYEFCRKDQRGFTEILQKQIYHKDMTGWKGLVSKYQSATAPSMNALANAGYATRTLDHVPQVRIGGVWMTTQSAAKAGLV